MWLRNRESNPKDSRERAGGLDSWSPGSRAEAQVSALNVGCGRWTAEELGSLHHRAVLPGGRTQ